MNAHVTPLPDRTADAQATACVWFDGACPLCRREVEAYRHAEGGAALHWIDASACPAPLLPPGVAREAALARLHVQEADGRVLSGAAAFVAIWQRLPALRWGVRAAQWPGVLPVLELAYRVFLRVRPLWRRPAAAPSPWPPALRRALRTDHAGETGAVMIYRGVLAFARDPAVRHFAARHLATEQRHLGKIEAVVPVAERSRLLPLWRAAGWLTGALPALCSARAVYLTVDAVETFVDQHYAEQLAWIDRHGAETLPVGVWASLPLASLRATLSACRQDELAHRDEARRAAAGGPGLAGRLWCAVVAFGSRAAVRASARL